jgi:hypothetical protein
MTERERPFAVIRPDIKPPFKGTKADIKLNTLVPMAQPPPMPIEQQLVAAKNAALLTPCHCTTVVNSWKR